MQFDSTHKKCFTQMNRKIISEQNEKHESFYLLECPECHYFITCEIQQLKDRTVEIKVVCESCKNYMNVLPDFVTPQRGVIYYRCYRCSQEVILHTLKPDLFSRHEI